MRKRKLRRTPTRHPGYKHGRSPSQEPSKGLDLALAVPSDADGNLIVELLRAALHRALLHAHRHLAVIKHTLEVVLERQAVLREALR